MTTTRSTGAPFNQKALSVHGREQEVNDVTAMLNQPECELVTLTGPAGIGKTSLALAIAQASSMPVAFISFEDSESASACEQAAQIDAALCTPDFAKQVGNRPTLLIIDSADELIGASHLLQKLLSRQLSLTVLAASRYPLEISQEWTVQVRGLNFRNSNSARNGNSNPPGLTIASQFFVERVRTRLSGFDPLPNERAINSICARLEGSPLGIRLAADLVGDYALPEIALLLTSDLDFLQARDASGPARRTSVRGAMDSCWRQLSQEQQTSFARLSMFAGGFSEVAACQIAHCNRKTLATLVECFWLRLECTRTTIRYTIHPLLRQYGLAQLSATIRTDPLAANLEQEHAEFFSALLCEHGRGLHAIDDESFYQIDLEHQNLQQAWVWLQAHRAGTKLIEFIDTFHLYCIYRDHRQEAADLLTSALALHWLPDEQSQRWQHLLDETRSRPERLHSAERRCLPRPGNRGTGSMRSRWLKGVAPSPGICRSTSVRM